MIGNNGSLADCSLGLVASPVTPGVTTLAANSIFATSAQLNGSVNPRNNNTTVSFEYGLTTSYGTTVSGVPSLVGGSTTTNVSASLSGLSSGVTYHYRLKGSSSAGTTNGPDLTFTTAAVAPTANTLAATAVTASSATLNGTVNAGGASTTVSFEYRRQHQLR